MRAFAAADRFLADAPEPELPISGADLIARGVAAGRPVGRALRAFQALWIRAGFPKEPETLARLLEEAVAASAQEVPKTLEPPSDRTHRQHTLRESTRGRSRAPCLKTS